MHVLEIGPGAMQENDRRRVGLPVRALPYFDHMLTEAADLDEAALRQMRAIDHALADQRDQRANTKNDYNNGERSHAQRDPVTGDCRFGLAKAADEPILDSDYEKIVASSLARA